MDNEVLVIGFGKIGQIKAKKWKELNCRVFIYDKNPMALTLAKDCGYEIAQKLDIVVDYIDICVPTAHHMDYILNPDLKAYKNIIVEKPIVSGMNELNQLIDLKTKFPEKIKKIILSEQYYYSQVLKKIKTNIQGEKIKSLSIKMNKNRSEDNKKGRFLDMNLRAYGIELPHIFAIADFLGIDICNTNFDHSNILFVNPTATTTGCLLAGNCNGTKIVFQSFLGGKKYDIDGQYKHNNLVERELSITTNQNIYKIYFDPVQGIQRYAALLITNKKRTIIQDDMIKNMFLNIMKGQPISSNNIEKAIKVSKKLINLRQCAEVKYI